MGVKKLHIVFMRYVLFLGIAILVIIVINIFAYMMGVQSNMIYPLNKISSSIESSKHNLQSAYRITEHDIPPLCDYIVFSKTGDYLGGSINQDAGNQIWNLCIENEKTSDNSYLYSVINRENEVLILRYRMTAQFSNTILRNLFPSADLIFILIVLLEIIFFLVGVSYKFGRHLGKEIDKLLTVVKKIEQQDLDFELEKSTLFEVSRALDALNHMRLALKHSLIKQWNDDKVRKDQLTALAHDLKTPLTIIRGNTELLLDTVLSTEQKECAEYIENSSIQMQNYVQTLIEVTKTWDRYQLCIQKIEIESLLLEIKKQIDGLCLMNNVTLNLRCKQKIKYISVDYDLFKRALVNVLSNAVEHTPQDGEINLEVYEKEGMLVLVIIDSGKGFSSEGLKHATEQFFMDDDSRNSKSHYGIGLYVAASVIQKHNGRIVLENSKITGGAKVIIELPY